VAGTKSIGAACQRLKRWVFERLKGKVYPIYLPT